MNKTDRKILLHLYGHKRTTNKELTKELGQQRTYLWERLQELIEQGYIKKPERGLYEITEEGAKKAKTIGDKGDR